MQGGLRFLLCEGGRAAGGRLSVGQREAADGAPGDIPAGELGRQRVRGDVALA